MVTYFDVYNPGCCLTNVTIIQKHPAYYSTHTDAGPEHDNTAMHHHLIKIFECVCIQKYLYSVVVARCGVDTLLHDTTGPSGGNVAILGQIVNFPPHHHHKHCIKYIHTLLQTISTSIGGKFALLHYYSG